MDPREEGASGWPRPHGGTASEAASPSAQRPAGSLLGTCAAVHMACRRKLSAIADPRILDEKHPICKMDLASDSEALDADLLRGSIAMKRNLNSYQDGKRRYIG